MSHPEVRLERLRPAEIDAALARANVAWVPLGALEYHGPHLPVGTDGFTGHGLLVRAAERLGGVVLPWSYLTLGTLRFPRSLRFDRELVEKGLRETLLQLADDGIGVLVVHTGHAPLDLIHLVKRVCAEVEASRPGIRTYGLCYLELNAALGVGLGSDWPVAVDHASTLETSWMLALDPDLVALDRLPPEPDAAVMAVYGPNPRLTADVGRGGAQVDAAVDLLAERVGGLVAGRPIDPLADLRGFVDRYWPEPLRLGAGSSGGSFTLTNPGAVSQYLSSLDLRLDGQPVAPDTILLVNPTPGESPVPVAAGSLGPETGFYVRRGQTAEVRLTDAPLPGRHQVELRVGLAGVTERTLVADVDTA